MKKMTLKLLLALYFRRENNLPLAFFAMKYSKFGALKLIYCSSSSDELLGYRENRNWDVIQDQLKILIDQNKSIRGEGSAFFQMVNRGQVLDVNFRYTEKKTVFGSLVFIYAIPVCESDLPLEERIGRDYEKSNNIKAISFAREAGRIVDELSSRGLDGVNQHDFVFLIDRTHSIKQKALANGYKFLADKFDILIDQTVSAKKNESLRKYYDCSTNLKKLLSSCQLVVKSHYSSSVENGKYVTVSYIGLRRILQSWPGLKNETDIGIEEREIVETLRVDLRFIAASVASQFLKEGRDWPSISSPRSQVYIDRNKVPALKEILEVLYLNSIEHGFTKVSLKSRCTLKSKKENERIILEWEDEGLGVTKEELQVIFESKGLIAQEKNIEYLMNLFLVEGVSTKLRASVLSGRGVGLSGALANIRSLGEGGDLTVKPRQVSGFRYRPVFSIYLPPSIIL